MTMRGLPIVGCVADNTPKYLDQALRLLQSWRWFAGSLADAPFHVCVIDGVSAEYRQKYERYGAHVHTVPRFSSAHPPSNKLRFLELPLFEDSGRIILLDCDTVIVQEPVELLCVEDFSAKIADLPTVTHDVFERLFPAFGLPLPDATERCSVHGEPTIPYFNAGVLSFSARAMFTLVPEWININRELINRLELLEQSTNFCEQASLSLALAKCKTSYRTLSNRLNFPAHCSGEPSDSEFAGTDPVIIHYHWLVDEAGFLQTSSYPAVTARIGVFNERLREERRCGFDNRAFWDQRYTEAPELGSGIGSRGELAAYKRALLESVFADVKPTTIMDIGCGDMAVSSVLPESGYTGIDLSPIVTAANAAAFPQRNFLCGDFVSMEVGQSDLVLCLDLLIHIPEKANYLKCVEKCVNATAMTGVIAAYETAPLKGSAITFFHEPIRHTLAEAGACDIRLIGAYNQVRVYQYWRNKRPSTKEPRLARPIFLVGTMRSGTTLLADLLGSSPHVAHCPFELKDVWSKVGGVPMASPKTKDRECPECDATKFSAGMKERLTEAFTARMKALPHKEENAVFLNKNPHLCNKLELVRALFPDARFIWTHRHLPQVVASIKRLFADVYKRHGTRHWWPMPTDNIRTRCWNVLDDDAGAVDVPQDRIFPGGNVRYLAEYWLESNRAVAEFFSGVARGGYINIAEESLISDTDNQLARLQGLLQLPFYQSENPPLDVSRNDHWRELLKAEELRELQCFVESIGGQLDALFPDEDRRQYYLRQFEGAHVESVLMKKNSRHC